MKNIYFDTVTKQRVIVGIDARNIDIDVIPVLCVPVPTGKAYNVSITEFISERFQDD